VQRSVVRYLEERRNDEAAKVLGRPPDEPLVYLERLRLADDQPVVLDCSWLPASLARPLLHVDFTRTALYHELQDRCGLRPDAGWERLRPVLLRRMAELDDAFEFRIAVEGAAARLAAQRRTKRDLGLLHKAYLELEQGRETARFRAADNVFHLAIADAAKNRFMRQAIENVRAMTWVPLDRVISNVFTSAHEHHAQILEAIENSDPDAAERAVVAHIQRAQQDLHRVIQ